MAAPSRRIPKFPQYQPAEKEPAKVLAALDAIAKEEEDEEEQKHEQDEEFLPHISILLSFIMSLFRHLKALAQTRRMKALKRWRI